MIQTNRLTEKLTIKELITSATTEGIPVKIWVTRKTIYATLLNQRGNFNFDSTYLGDTYEDTASFYCRYIDLPKKNTLVTWNCKEYSIMNISHTGPRRKSETIIDCKGVQ